MARPDSDWVAVAWMSDTSIAANVVDYLETCGVSAWAPEGGRYAVGEAPVFVAANDAGQARDFLRQLEAGSYPDYGPEGSGNVVAEQLREDLASAPRYRPPSALARWAPFIVIPMAIAGAFFGAPLIRSLLGL